MNATLRAEANHLKISNFCEHYIAKLVRKIFKDNDIHHWRHNVVGDSF